MRSCIARIYYRAKSEPVGPRSSLDEWLKQDAERVAETDTLHLQTQVQELKAQITKTIDSISDGEPPSTDWTFAYGY